MDKFEGYIFTALCSTNFLVSCLIFSKITREQREPYMDEIFHVPQAQEYCHGNFNQWDPMITTLPGLYLVSVGIIKPMVRLANMSGEVVCSTAMLRFINLLFNCGNLYLLYRLVCRLHPKDKAQQSARRILSALSLSTFPVLYFFNFLYYTDVGSTFFVLFTYLMTLHGCHKASALLGVCAVFFRQTNVVWVTFCAGTLAAGLMDDAWKARCKKSDDKSASFQVPLSLSGIKRVALFSVEFWTSVGNVKAVLRVAWPYALVAAGFLTFVWRNGGGGGGGGGGPPPPPPHACLNFPQLFYFVSFALFFSLPVSLCQQRLRRFLQAMKKQPVLFLAATVVSVLLVWRFTFVHKYLLADNRHFTFYVWRHFYRRHEVQPFLLIPIYIFAGWHFTDSLKSRSLFWSGAFLACLLAITVPQKLLEFRYFIIPYLMYRLHMPLPSLPRLALEFALYTAVNAVTIYIFVAKTFRYPDSAAIQRFMW